VDEVREDGTAVARSMADAPEIDGQVYVDDGRRLRVGDFARVAVTSAQEHDLHACRAET
jgi:ribosomal protein S12 methylthiotransferase